MEQGMSTIQVEVSGFSRGSRRDEVGIPSACWKEYSMKLTCKESCDVLTPKARRLLPGCCLPTSLHPKISQMAFFQGHIISEQDTIITCQSLFTKGFVFLTQQVLCRKSLWDTARSPLSRPRMEQTPMLGIN